MSKKTVNANKLNSVSKHLRKNINSFEKICLSTLGENIKAIILFGSIVKGKYDQDSDFDFCIVVKKYPEFDRKLGARIMELCDEAGIRHSVEPIFITEDGLKDFSSPFTLEVISDGVVVYGDYPLEDLRRAMASERIRPIYEEEVRIGWELSTQA